MVQADSIHPEIPDSTTGCRMQSDSLRPARRQDLSTGNAHCKKENARH